MRMESVDMQVRWYPASSTVQWSVIGDVRITARETARVGCVYTRCARECVWVGCVYTRCARESVWVGCVH